ncbi:cation diffusion facilitator family transporter [Mesoterricola silvestris]|uniref:Cation transporter n=1 Tax=Mesoterricola silvestris TaxID=2927979 RepID=A0AA48K9X7_9BACT|nr:cation diffusion facilitator family transporter [Mesoterricola silvestris]BDU73535.1 cation transporter [Mesoterricola silvestris]
MEEEVHSQRSRIRVSALSITAGLCILALKYYAFQISHSAALKSDAIENVVNVVAAVFALGAIIFAGKPADREHPYGHGKIEHFSAAFEGGMISLAAVLIGYEAVHSLVDRPPLEHLGRGMAVNFTAGVLNGALGLYLIHCGKKQKSLALEADGHHVLSDFYTTVGMGLGLILLTLTGWQWLDAIIALGVGALLAWTGFKLVRSSSAALLDTEDPDLLDKIVAAINRIRPKDILAIHELRTLRSGRHIHVDIHMVVPEFYGIAQSHDLADAFAKSVVREAGIDGEFHTHVDPCQRCHCEHCAVEPCPIRTQAQERTLPITIEEAVAAGPV